MNRRASVAGETPSQLKCKETALASSSALSQLTSVMDQGAGIPFSSLVPAINALNEVVLSDDASRARAATELSSLIEQRTQVARLDNLPAIAEINFLQAVSSVVAYKAEENRSAVNTPLISSTRNTPIRQTVRRAPKIEDDTVKATPARKSRGRSIGGDGTKINCIFKGCNAKFSTTLDLAAHAEECTHKSNLSLVFRCSGCMRPYASHKAVKSHIGHKSSNCAAATVIVDTEQKPREKKNRRESLTSAIGGGDDSQSQMLACPFKDCRYSSKNFEHVYVHAKSAHPDQSTSFKCLNCGITRQSGKAIQRHAQKCNNAQVELKLSKKPDSDESAMFMTKKDIVNQTTRVMSTRMSVPRQSMNTRKASPYSTKSGDGESKADDAEEMPELEMMDSDDEVKEEMEEDGDEAKMEDDGESIVAMSGDDGVENEEYDVGEEAMENEEPEVITLDMDDE